MSFLFLECDDLRRLLPAAAIPPCCNNCHAREKNKGKIYVSPWKEDGWNTDWAVCVQLVVCCGIYDFARSLDRSFYLQQATLHNVGRDDGRGYIFPSHPSDNTERPRNVANPQSGRQQTIKARVERTKASIKRSQQREEEGGLDAWRRS